MRQNNTEFAEKYITELEDVPCNACGGRVCEVIAERERFGLPLHTVGLELVGYQDEVIESRKMTRRDFRKLGFSYMIFLSRPARAGKVNVSKPDHQDILGRIHANQEAYIRDGKFIEQWRKPTFFMRVYRKVLNLLGMW